MLGASPGPCVGTLALGVDSLAPLLERTILETLEKKIEAGHWSPPVLGRHKRLVLGNSPDLVPALALLTGRRRTADAGQSWVFLAPR